MSKQIINAFHPDYVRTYAPEILSELRVLGAQTQAGKTLSGYVEKRRKSHPSHGTVFGISKKVTSVEPKKMLTRKTGKSMTMIEIHDELAEILNRNKDKKNERARTRA